MSKTQTFELFEQFFYINTFFNLFKIRIFNWCFKQIIIKKTKKWFFFFFFLSKIGIELRPIRVRLFGVNSVKERDEESKRLRNCHLLWQSRHESASVSARRGIFQTKGPCQRQIFLHLHQKRPCWERHWVVVKMTLFNSLLWLQALTFSTQIWQLEMEAGGWRTKKSSRVHCFCFGFFACPNDSDLQSVICRAFCNHLRTLSQTCCI